MTTSTITSCRDSQTVAPGHAHSAAEPAFSHVKLMATPHLTIITNVFVFVISAHNQGVQQCNVPLI